MATGDDPTKGTIDGLKNLADRLKDQKDLLKEVGQAAERLYGRDFPRLLNLSRRDLDRTLRDIKRKIDAESNAISTQYIKLVTGTDLAGAIALKRMGINWGKTLGESLLGSFSSQLSFGLPIASRSLAMILGPINQISKIGAENNKILATLSASYGQVLPASIKTLSKELGNLDLRYQAMANRYGIDRKALDASRSALLENTVIQSKHADGTRRTALEIELLGERYTETVMAMSKLQDVDPSQMTAQLIDLQKSLNVSLERAPRLYADVNAYAVKAGVGTQFFNRTVMDLSVSLKSQGADFKDYAGFIATATERLEKLGASERTAIEDAQQSLRGLSGVGQGMSMFMSQNLLRTLSERVKAGGEGAISESAAAGLKRAAFTFSGGKEMTTKQSIEFLRANPMAGAFLSQTMGASPEWRSGAMQSLGTLSGDPRIQALIAMQQMGQTVGSTGALIAGKGQRGFTQAAGEEEDARAARERAKDMTKYFADANTIGQSQLTYWEKGVNIWSEMSRGITTLITLSSVAALGTGYSLYRRIGAEYAEGRGAVGAMRAAFPGAPMAPAGGAGGAKLGGRFVNFLATHPGVVGAGVAAGGGLYGYMNTNENTTATSFVGGVAQAGAAGVAFGGPVGAGFAMLGYETTSLVKVTGQAVIELQKTKNTLAKINSDFSDLSAKMDEKYNSKFSGLDAEHRGQALQVYQGLLDRARHRKSGDTRGPKNDIDWLMASYGVDAGGFLKNKEQAAELLRMIASATTGVGGEKIEIPNGSDGSVTVITTVKTPARVLAATADHKNPNTQAQGVTLMNN